MTRKPTAQVDQFHECGTRQRSVFANWPLRTILALTSVGIAYAAVVGLGANGPGHASERVGRNFEQPRDPAAIAQARPSVTLDTLQRLPDSLRTTLQATKALSVKDACRAAETLVAEPAAASIDTIAQYLSKDVHRWSDRMINLYLDTDPKQAKATDKGEMKKRLLQKWEADRAMVHRWLRGCGIVVRTAIGRSRPVIEREAPEVLADIVSAIAIGWRKKEPDAIAAAEALTRTEESLRALLR